MNSSDQGGEGVNNPAADEGRRPPIKLGDYHKTITMADIAKAAGVSQGAISSLLNDRDYGIRVSEKTRERVFKTCREMSYIPNDLRAVVRMGSRMRCSAGRAFISACGRPRLSGPNTKTSFSRYAVVS